MNDLNQTVALREVAHSVDAVVRTFDEIANAKCSNKKIFCCCLNKIATSIPFLQPVIFGVKP
jgi:hypothetical protein